MNTRLKSLIGYINFLAKQITIMKKPLLCLLFLCSTSIGYAQTTEFSSRLNSGFFYFSGESVESTSQINYNLLKEDGYTNNPYGNRPTLSYGISASLSRITKSNIRFGIDVGYEVLRSNIDLDLVFLRDGINSTSEKVNGQTFLNNSFVNFFPSIGYRLTINSFVLDFDLGVDVANFLSSTEVGKANSNTRSYETERDRKNIESDVRGRYQLTISRDKIGAYFGFTNGIKSYKEGIIGGTNSAFSRMIRFGFVYKIK